MYENAAYGSDPGRLAIGVIVTSAAALGYGLLAGRFTKSDSNLAREGTIGIAILAVLGMAENFFVPLRQPWNLLTLLPGVIALPFLFKRRFLPDFVVITVMVWWAVQLSRTGAALYDFSLYHLQAVLWNSLDRTIPGLANLHTRLGFNSSVMVLASGLNIPGLGGWSLSFLATALIEAMITADFVLSLRSEKTIVRVYSMVVLVCLLLKPRWLLDQSYLSVDPIIAMGMIYVVLLFLDSGVPELLLIVPFLITVKLSSAPLLLLLYWNRLSLKKYRVAALLGTLFLFIWVARNVVLSGHLLFPVAATRLPVAWAVPKGSTQSTAAWITSWARIRGGALSETEGLGWILPWFHSFVRLERVQAVASMVALGVILLAWKRSLRPLDWRLLSVLALALLFWFVEAPGMRFGIGFLFAFGFLLLAYGLNCIEAFQLSPKVARIAQIFVVAAMGLSAPRHASPDWPKVDRPAVQLAATPSGNQIWTPVSGDQCWDVMPCAPNPDMISYYPERALLSAPIP
jgi:hypothetical protein